MIQNPHKAVDCDQSLVIFSNPSTQFYQKLFIAFWVIQPTDRRTDKRTNTVTWPGGQELSSLFLIIWRTVLLLCLSTETSLNIFFSHRTITPSAFEVITETRYINYLLTYLLTIS